MVTKRIRDAERPWAKAWAEQVVIPTYEPGPPNPNPMFLEKRVYQGSSGAVYPYPVVDRIATEKRDKVWQAIFLENRWIKVMVLPELGGRVHMALDKTDDYHFIYHNRVIKPALVGLAGPWISGGIEFNWPQHHRPNTFGPVEWTIEKRPGGAWTVWCSEIDRMARTKALHGLTIRPNRAVLTVEARLFNRTSEPQTFLWWANPAVHVNDDYQSVFPSDVRAVLDHGKRAVSDFPVATGTYYKVDYSPGTDISRYKNIPVPTSYMAYKSDFDFLGDYDHGKRAGMLHVANHHVSPGKKQWTWGNGEFGRRWDKLLTDEDGPYIELMCGVYTDNQPDFSWLMPGEEKAFVQHFMPYRGIGPAKNATVDAAVNLEMEGTAARLGVYVTGPRRVTVRLTRGARILFRATAPLTPERPLLRTVRLPPGTKPPELTLAVHDASDGRLLVSYAPPRGSPHGIPKPAKTAPPPREIATTEQLYLTGLHLEQYRHATRDPQAYYEEALRRDPADARNNNALGLLLYRRGRFREAETRFRAALAALMSRNGNPYDGEPSYNLGLALRMQGRFDEAFGAFYKAAWNAAWQDAAYFELARIACRRGRLEEALDLVDRSLSRNTKNRRAAHLRTAVLRKLGRPAEARAQAKSTLAEDPLDFGALNELALLDGASAARLRDRRIRLDPRNCVELALDYAHAGFFAGARRILDIPPATALTRVYQGWFAAQEGDPAATARCFRQAAALPVRLVFPNELECVPALEAAMRAFPGDGKAPYLLGLFLYARRDHDRAIALWERSRRLDTRFPTVHRNLGLAYANKRGDFAAARAAFRKAFALDPADARVLFELDQLEKKSGTSPAERLALLDRHPEAVRSRDDLAVERAALLNRLGRYEDALAWLGSRVFQPWEGGEGKVSGQYVFALLSLARRRLASGDPRGAAALLDRARTYPDNLGEGKLSGAQENPLNCHHGEALAALGDAAGARARWLEASKGLSEPASAVFYNDAPPDTIFFQGLALRKLGRAREARARFRKLVSYARTHMNDQPAIDYFAISLPDFLVFDEDLARRNRIHCLYMEGLGCAGLGRKNAAARALRRVLRLDPAHLGAYAALTMIGRRA